MIHHSETADWWRENEEREEETDDDYIVTASPPPSSSPSSTTQARRKGPPRRKIKKKGWRAEKKRAERAERWRRIRAGLPPVAEKEDVLEDPQNYTPCGLFLFPFVFNFILSSESKLGEYAPVNFLEGQLLCLVTTPLI